MRNRLAGLEIQERIALRKIRNAIEVARNRDSVTRRDRQILRPSKASDLNAANPFSRILLGNALWSEYLDHFGLSEIQSLPNIPLYWVSLVDIGCMTPLDAESIDIASMTRQLRCGLEGLSYFGFVDLALYANIQPGTWYDKKTGVNWHLHLFAWGESRKEIRTRAKTMNDLADNYRPLIHNKGFDWEQVTPDSLMPQFRYMCKTPKDAYRIGKRDPKHCGEGATVRFKSNTDDLRPGEHITLFHLLKRHWLDDLVVAGGDGVGIRRRAIRSALSQVR